MQAMVTLEQHWFKGASDAERSAAQAVVNLDHDEIDCPACSARFAKQGRCPECGLNLGF